MRTEGKEEPKERAEQGREQVQPVQQLHDKFSLQQSSYFACITVSLMTKERAVPCKSLVHFASKVLGALTSSKKAHTSGTLRKPS